MDESDVPGCSNDTDERRQRRVDEAVCIMRERKRAAEPHISTESWRNPKVPKMGNADAMAASQSATVCVTNAERMRTARARLLEEEKAEQRQKDAERKRLLRQQQSLSEKVRATHKDAIRKTQARANTSDAQRIIARQNDSNRKKKARANMSDAQRDRERQNDSIRKKKARANLSDSQNNVQRKKNAVRMKTVRSSETEDQHQSRLQAMRNNARQRYAQQKEITWDALNIIEAEEFSVGDMDDACANCGALFYEGEWVPGNPDGVYNSCCLKGSFEFLDLFKDFPVKLRQLFERNYGKEQGYDKNFHECIRQFNSANAVGSLKAQTVNFNSYGPYCYKIHGQIYHTVNLALHPDEHESPSFAQLFIIDTAEATAQRMNFPANKDCDKGLMTDLDDILRSVSPYYKSLKMLKEVEEEQAKEAARLGMTPPQLKLLFDLKKDSDHRRYNMPRCSEVASVFVVDENGELPPNDGISVHLRGKQLKRISKLDRRCDSMLYPLFFPSGTGGWHVNMKTTDGKKVTMEQYYRYLLARRKEYIMVGNTLRSFFSPIHYGGKLFQQFLVDVYVRVEQDRLDWIRANQKQLKVESYKGLTDFLKDSPEGSASLVGKDYILPSSFTGSPRSYQQRYQDAMSIVRKYGKADIFLTFTGNPKWPEIQRRLKPGQTASDTPDLVNRVFRLKVRQLLSEIKERGIFGRVIAYSYAIEWQKRGCPHCHMLLILAPECKIRDASAIDKYVSATLPDKVKYPRLRDLVEQHMMHGPCGKLDPTCGCMVDGKCRFNYPKQFNEETSFGVDSYANYKRPNNGDVIYKKGFPLDSRHVAPYNPYLLTRFGAHLNVEICASVKSVKYLYKYVYKGWDAITVTIEANGQEKVERDELKKFVDMRFVTPQEAHWRLAEFDLFGTSHTIKRLAIHLPDEQVICFNEGDNLEDVVEEAAKRNSTLTAFFELNKRDTEARKLLYFEVPEFYTYKMVKKKVTYSSGEENEVKNMEWMPRSSGAKPCIGRIYTINPKDDDLFYLRVLLLHRKGPTSFEDIRTVDGTTYQKYKEAARAMGLVGNDDELENCLAEACEIAMPRQLRQLFVKILLFGEVKEPRDLWRQFKDHLSEDFARNHEENHARKLAKLAMEEILNREGTSLSQFGIKVPDLPAEELQQLWDREEQLKIGEEMKGMMNKYQCTVVDKVNEKLARIDSGETTKACFFVDSPGGGGKTYTIRTLCHLLRGHGKRFMAMAYTGCAATLLPDGKTLHKSFTLPVPTLPDSLSNVKPNSKQAKDILSTDVFFIDEAPMCANYMIEAVDKKLRHLTGNGSVLFGGKIFVLSGDFRQVTPVRRYASKTDLIKMSIKNSKLFKEMEVIRLKKNMRALPEEKDFAKFLLKVGNGDLQNEEEDDIKLPEQILSNGNLVEEVLLDCINAGDYKSLASRVILCTTNEACKKINDEVLPLIPGEEKTFFSEDLVDKDEAYSYVEYPDKFLHTLEGSGLPPHELKLKRNVPILLLRNLNISEGLTNGTRLLVREIKQSVLLCEIMTGDKAREMALIPRIMCTSTEGNFPFKLSRHQFPVRLCFSMTMNKSQGGTFDKVGVDLEHECFSHGQAYTAFSRVRSWEGLKVKVPDEKIETKCTKNVVWKDALLR